jgi:peptidylprolyl isomerase/peptidyl-prolyl cis-trans isomerase B (cyclophilin B)
LILNYWIVSAIVLALAYVVWAFKGKSMARKKKQFEPVEAGRQPKVSLELEKGGSVEMELYPDSAPQHVASFLSLIGKGFYDGLTFHRVVPGFVAQGGCPDGTGMGGPGYTVPAEFNDRPHLTGTLAMARSSDPDSAGSQFYICLAPQPGLDGDYTVFGQVTTGMDLVQGIRVGDKIRKIAVLS